MFINLLFILLFVLFLRKEVDNILSGLLVLDSNLKKLLLILYRRVSNLFFYNKGKEIC